jgi:uncharacterized protein (DUF1697 family)
MAKYIALLRGINVGGSGVISMKDLAALCAELGCDSVRTYIQSGNVLFESKLGEKAIRAKLEKALTERLGKQVDVMMRTPDELRQVLRDNPFAEKEGAKVGISFLAGAPPKDLMSRVQTTTGEDVRPGAREVYVYYPVGMGNSKLKMKLEGPATVRNANTVAKLITLAEG